MREDKNNATSTGTPILDSGVLPPRMQAIKLIGVVNGFLIGITPGIVGVILALTGRQVRENLGFDFLSLLFVLVLATTVHEVGHLVAGWTMGFRFSLIQIGPLSLRIVHGVLRARFRNEIAALGYAGMHVNRLRRRMLIYIIAGPTVNLVSVPITVLLLYKYFPHKYFPQLVNTWLVIPVFQFAIVSLLFFVVNLIPFSPNTTSDGARIAMLLRSRDRARRWLSIMALVHANEQGTVAKLWKDSWLRAACSLNDASRDNFRGKLLAYISENGREYAPVAAGHLEKCLELSELLPVSTRDVLAQEATVFAAWFRNDALLADKWFTQVRKPKLMSPLAQIRVLIAQSCARRDFDRALEQWQEGLALIERTTAGTSRKRLKESWLEWQADIRARQIRPPIMEGGYTVRPTTVTT